VVLEYIERDFDDVPNWDVFHEVVRDLGAAGGIGSLHFVPEPREAMGQVIRHADVSRSVTRKHG
jgi:hypothetical protein